MAWKHGGRFAALQAENRIAVLDRTMITVDLVREAFENHLQENEVSVFAMQRVDDREFFYSKTKTHIF